MRQRNVAAKEAVVRESERRELELRHMRELWESQARFREVVTSALDAIILFDDSDNITLFNSAAERMFTCASSDAVGSSIARFFPDEPEAIDQLRAFAEGRDGTERPSGEPAASVRSLSARRATGESFPIEVSVSLLKSPRDTTYTLSALGADGSTASASFAVKVNPPPPKIEMLSISAKEIKRRLKLGGSVQPLELAHA